jgi:phosphatidylserine/phosphatidylglycerophosphate/cardiolipin synthase-like enzyme
MKISLARILLALVPMLFAGCDNSGESVTDQHGATVTEQNTQVYFSPKGGCTQAVVAELDKAKTSIRVQAYSFTSAPIAKALVDAHKRGVKIEVILDKSQKSQHYTEADFIAHAEIPTFIDSTHSIAHNKVIIIDNETVLTGSFNFTKAAEEHNAENLLVIHDKALAMKYDQNWQAHLAHSARYEGR